MYDVEAGKLRQMSLKEYKKMKIRILEDDFIIKLTKEDIDRINNAENDIKVDQICLSLIMNSY